MSDTCPHCGAPLRRAAAEIGGRRIELPAFEPCQCDGAKAERAETLFKAEAERLEDEHLRSLRRREHAGIPRRYLRATHPDASVLYEALGEGLYLTGGVGAGKTHLACAIANLVSDAGRRVRFASGVQALAMERASYGGDGDGLAPLIACDLLVLDDLGKERPTEWALEQLFRVVDGRYNAMRPLIVTSQYPRGELARRLAKGESATAQAIVSRLCGMCRVHEVGGGDRRLA